MAEVLHMEYVEGIKERRHLVLVVPAPQYNGRMVAQPPHLVLCLRTNIVKKILKKQQVANNMTVSVHLRG